MDPLLQDPWLQACGAGFLLSLIALPFTFRRYRQAVSAALPEIPAPLSPMFDDTTEPVGPVAPPARRPAAEGKFLDARDVLAGPSSEPSRPPTSSSRPPNSPGRQGTGVVRPPTGAAPPAGASPKAAPSGPPTTGSIKSAAATNQAVAYLQTLKNQMEVFQKEILELRGQVQSTSQKQEQRFEALLDRLVTLQDEMHRASPQPSASASAPAPAERERDDDIPLPEMPSVGENPDARTGKVELDILPTSALLGRRGRAGRRPAAAEQASAESTAPRAVFKGREPARSLEPIEEASAPAKGLGIELTPPAEAAPAGEPASAEEPATDPLQESVAVSFPELSEAASSTDAAPAEEPAAGEGSEEAAAREDSQPIQEKEAPSAGEEDDILRPSGKGPVWPV